MKQPTCGSTSRCVKSLRSRRRYSPHLDQTYVSESSHPFDCLKQEAIDYTIRMWKVQGRSRVLPSRLEGPCSPSPGSFTLILGRS